MSDLPLNIAALAKLAGIRLSAQEAEGLQADLQAMLRLADALPQADIDPDTLEAWVAEGLPPTPLREDVPLPFSPGQGEDLSPLLNSAPERRGPFFSIPRLLDP